MGRLSGVVMYASIVLTTLRVLILAEQGRHDQQFSPPQSPPVSNDSGDNSSSKGYPFSSAGVPRQGNRPQDAADGYYPPPQQYTVTESSVQEPGDSNNENSWFNNPTGDEDYSVASDRIRKGYPFSSAGVPKGYLNDDKPADEQSMIFSGDGDYEEGNNNGRRRLTPPAQYSLSPPPATSRTRHNFPPLRTPIVYRYYGRQKTRTAQAGSIPFILLGPNVDHWKVTGQQLSARGFNVIAVGPRDAPSSQHDARYQEGPGLILQLMDALRWNKVVLVGCDSEAALAIQAALMLAPDRVVGLILCGTIESSSIMEQFSGSSSTRTKNLGEFELDQYLHERLQCPFMIIWDGDTPKRSSGSPAAAATTSSSSNSGNKDLLDAQRHRSVIIGGGSAPHRRRPEIFAWVLTRFVEEKFAPSLKVDNKAPQRRTQRKSNNHPPFQRHHYAARNRPFVELPWRVDGMFNEESFVVFGRVAATALFYAMALRVMFYQYDNLRGGYNFITSTKRNIVDKIRKIAWKVGSLFFFFRRRDRPSPNIGLDKDRISEDDSVDESAMEDDDKDDDEEPEEEEEDRDEEESDAETEIDAETTEPEVSPKSAPERELRRLFFLDHVVA